MNGLGLVLVLVRCRYRQDVLLLADFRVAGNREGGPEPACRVGQHGGQEIVVVVVVVVERHDAARREVPTDDGHRGAAPADRRINGDLGFGEGQMADSDAAGVVLDLDPVGPGIQYNLPPNCLDRGLDKWI